MLLLILVLTFTAVHAYQLSYPGFAGVTNAVAYKDVWYSGGSVWYSNIRSNTDSPVYAIDRIGWNWWTVRDTCDGTILDQQTYGGAVDYQDSLNMQTESNSYSKGACLPAQTYKIWSIGKHDFYENGNIWQPTYSYNETY